MDPLHPTEWKTDQRQFANLSISEDDSEPETDNETSSLPSSTSSEDGYDFVVKIVYHRLAQSKKTYKVILEEEDLIS